MKKKRFQPKNIHDLEDIYYDPREGERKYRYETFTDSKIFDRTREIKANKIMSKLGESSKIPREHKKTFDYEIKESEIIYEITSIQPSKDERITQRIKQRNEQDFIEDVNKAINHLLEKEDSDFLNYLKGVIIFIDSVLVAFSDYCQYSKTPSLIEQSIFSNANIDFLILTPIPVSINKELIYVAYVKNNNLFKVFNEDLPEEFMIYQVS